MTNEEAVKPLEKDIKQYAIDIKNYCKDRSTCTGCPFDKESVCKLTNDALLFLPEDWEVWS